MGAVKVIELGKDKRKFDPITIQVNVKIETEQELAELYEEFREGSFDHIETQYSDILYKYVNDFKTFIMNR